MAQDIRREAANVTPTQATIKPVAETSPLGAIAGLIDNGIDLYKDYAAGQKTAADNRDLADFQISLIDTSLGESSTVKRARTVGAKLDAAEEQSINANVIRTKRIRELRSFINEDPAKREEYNKIFKTTAGDLSDELQEQVDFNIDYAVELEAKAAEETRDAIIKGTAFEWDNPEAQDARVDQVTKATANIQFVLNKVASAERLGKPMKKDQLKKEFRSTVPGAYHMADLSIRKNLSQIDNINTAEGRILAQNTLISLKSKFMVQLQESTGYTFSTEELKDIYAAPLAQYDNALLEASREGTSIKDIVTNTRLLSQEVAKQTLDNTPEKFIIQEKMNRFFDVASDPILGRLISRGTADPIVKMFEQTIALVAAPGGTLDADGKPVSPTQSTVTPSISVVGLPPSEATDTIEIISSFLDNSSKELTSPIKTGPDTTPGKELGDKKETKTLVKTVIDAVLAPFNNDADSSTGKINQDLTKMLGNENLIGIGSKHSQEAAQRLTTMTATSLAIDLNNKVSAGNIRGLQGITKESLQDSVYIQIDPDTGTVSFVNSDSNFLPLVTVERGLSSRVSSFNADVASALNFHYQDSLTEMVRATAVSDQGNTDWDMAFTKVNATLQAAGGPKFLTAEEFKSPTKLPENGNFEGRSVTGMDILSSVKEASDLFDTSLLNVDKKVEDLLRDLIAPTKHLNITDSAFEDALNDLEAPPPEKLIQEKRDKIISTIRDRLDSLPKGKKLPKGVTEPVNIKASKIEAKKSAKDLQDLLDAGIITQKDIDSSAGLQFLQQYGGQQ